MDSLVLKFYCMYCLNWIFGMRSPYYDYPMGPSQSSFTCIELRLTVLQKVIEQRKIIWPNKLIDHPISWYDAVIESSILFDLLHRAIGTLDHFDERHWHGKPKNRESYAELTIELYVWQLSVAKNIDQ